MLLPNKFQSTSMKKVAAIIQKPKALKKILLAAYINFPPQSSTPSPVYYTRIVKSDDDGQEWKEAAKSAMKKFAGRYNDYRKTIDRQNTEEASRQLSLTEARKVVIKQDENLPAAVRLKVFDQNAKGITPRNDTVAGTRVKVVGRIDNIRASKTGSFGILQTLGAYFCASSLVLSTSLHPFCSRNKLRWRSTVRRNRFQQRTRRLEIVSSMSTFTQSLVKRMGVQIPLQVLFPLARTKQPCPTFAILF